MNEFLEIGEIVEAISEPLSVVKPTITPPPINILPTVTSPTPKVDSKQLLYLLGGVAVGVLIYYLIKKYNDENTDSRDKL